LSTCFSNEFLYVRLNERSCSTCVSEPKFKITKHPLLLKTICAVDFAIQRSMDVGIELKQRKAEAIRCEEE
jgi:hypothetical protein